MLRWLKRALLFFAPWLCRWHKGEPAVSYDPEGDEVLAYCPECGRMLDTRDCIRCGQSFIDWGSTLSGDDVMAAVMANGHGDVCCTGCYVPERYEDEEEA